MSSPFERFKSRYKAGQFVFRDGDIGTDMYIVQSGRIDLVKEVSGNEVVIAHLEKADFFGEMAVLESLPRNLSARVVEDCEVIAINGTTFDKMIKSNIEIAVRMLRKFSTRLREANAENVRLRDLNRDLEARVAAAPAASVPVPPTVISPQPGTRPAPPRPTVTLPPATVAPVVAASPSPAAAPAPASSPVSGHLKAVLTVKGGEKTFDMVSDEVTIGRADPVTGLRPEIDLTNEDLNRFISRRHAKILLKDGTWYLVEEVGVTNGTYLNGKRLQAGVYTPIQFGDELCFGKVFLMFDRPK